MNDENTQEPVPPKGAPAAPLEIKDVSERPWFDFKASHWTTAGLTFALLVVAVVQSCIYHGQERIMQQQRNLMSNQGKVMRTQTKIMGTQARTMDTQTKIMDIQSRPWVGYMSATAISPLSAGKPFVVQIEIENSGGSPALDVHVCSSIGPSGTKYMLQPVFRRLIKLIPPCTQYSRLFILPRAALARRVIQPGSQVSTQLVKDLNDGKKTLVVNGTIAYQTPLVKHAQTHFCVYYKKGIFVNCPFGNEAD